MERRASAGRIIDTLALIWNEGYVFLPWIAGDAADKDERRASYHEGVAYEWPKDRKKIETHLREHWNDDVYFCPNTFEKPQRLEQYASPERCLYADLDEANPDQLDLRPTIAWESTPSIDGEDPHWQAIWVLEHELVGASWPGKENHKLTYAIDGADPSGWDTTQLLRLPGWPNHKPERREANGGKPPIGKILWARGPKYRASDFNDLPDVKFAAEATEALEMEIDHIDRHKVWSKIRMRLSPQVRQLVLAKDTAGADRSEVLWRIERDLADVGLTPAEIVAIIRKTVWNKYEGRADELKRLTTEALKAVAAKDEKALEETNDLEVRDRPGLPGEVLKDIRRPRWLIDQIWQEGSCGFISGPPKAYKSYTAWDMAFSLAAGLPFLDVFRIDKPRNVLYIGEEDPLPIMKQRYDEMVAGKDRSLHYEGFMAWDDGALVWKPPSRTVPLYMYINKGFKASDPAWQSWLDEMIEELELGMVFVDTLGTAAGDVDVDRYHEVNDRILAPLKDLAHRRDTALAIIHHTAKGRDSLDGQAMLGSTAFHGWVEDALYFGYRNDGFRCKRESKLDRPLFLSVDIPYITRDDGWHPIVERHEADPGTAGGISESPTNEASERELDLSKTSKQAKRVPGVVKIIRSSGGKLDTESIMSMSKLRRSEAFKQLRRAEDAGLLRRVSKDDSWELVADAA